MANCPECERDWLWDRKDHVLRLASDPMLTAMIVGDMEYKCFCGNDLGRLEKGQLVDVPDFWKRIDWDDPSNRYK